MALPRPTHAMRVAVGMAAAAILLGGCQPAFGARVSVPFGQGWAFHLGDSPDGPGLGSGSLAGFRNRSSCTNMQSRHLWAPQGAKSAGQAYSSCAVACSYNADCTAYEAGDDDHTCYHGFGDTVCSGNGTEPPPAPPGTCEPLSLVKQASHFSNCTEGTSFGCVPGRQEMYVDHGCSGIFSCHGRRVTCISNNYQRAYCSCPAANSPPRGGRSQLQQRGAAGFQRSFTFAASGLDDAAWPRVTLPHDPLINQTFDAGAGEGSGFLPRRVVWYRKRFAVPRVFRGQHVFLYFEGAFQYAEFYLNGHHLQDHGSGYTSFTVRLDNASSLVYGPGTTNVLAVRVDPSFGSGHWYEGGGINRPVRLVFAPLLHFVQGGLFPSPNSNATALRVTAEIEDLSAVDGREAELHIVTVALRDASGKTLAFGQQSIQRVGSVLLTPGERLQTWSPQTPVTYTVTATVGDDEVNVTTAVRTFDWQGPKARLNGQEIELQGFSHHPSFAGMGAMTSPRLALFLAQTTKALGVNFWRNSHNPYEDAVYEMLTAVGVMCWDENRNFGTDQANEYHDMIKAHRHHAAVMLWGLCNEGQCGVEDGAAARAFMEVKNKLDPERPQTGNLVDGQDYNFPHVDIIAESGSAELYAWHQQNPTKPITAGEHGFGNNVLYDSRGPEDRALARLGNVSQVFSGTLENGGKGWFNLRPRQTIPFLLSSHGLGMWAMMDYYGEAWMGWPTVIKSRGHLDVAGFPKPTAWWYRTNYLANVNVSEYQRPLVGGNWRVQLRVLTPCQMFASTPAIEVYFDGISHGRFVVSKYGLVDLRDGSSIWPPGPGPNPCSVSLVQQASEANCSTAAGSFGCYSGLDGMWVDKGCRGSFSCNGGIPMDCACETTQGFCSHHFNCSCNPRACRVDAQNITVVGLDSAGKAVGSHSLITASAVTQMAMVVDVPSKATGTGDALYLDGQDIALVRVQLMDAAGVVSRTSDSNVTFSVVSGPIRVVGVGSGNIRNHQPVQGHTYETWQGLARVVVQATVDCTGEHRSLAREIDVGAAPSMYPAACPTMEFAVLHATSHKFSATVQIPLSAAPEDAPLAVARATRHLDGYTYFEDVQA